MAPDVGAVIATPERRDPTASAVARPVNKAPGRRAVITTPQSGGPFARVPPASTQNEREDRSRQAETLLGLGSREPVRLAGRAPQHRSLSEIEGDDAIRSARCAKQP